MGRAPRREAGRAVALAAAKALRCSCSSRSGRAGASVRLAAGPPRTRAIERASRESRQLIGKNRELIGDARERLARIEGHHKLAGWRFG